MLGDERAAIAAALTGRENVFTFVPGRLVPPAAVVTPADPSIERRDGDTFGHATAGWEVWLIQATGPNDQATAQLDTDIEGACEQLTAAGFAVEQVSEPFMYQIQNANYLTAIVHVTTGVTFTT